VPLQVLLRRMHGRGRRMVAQGLVHWSGSTEDQATWEDLDDLHRRFPQAPAWGQAGIQEGEIVNDLGTSTRRESSGPAQEKPKRSRRGPRWLTDGNWLT
jgi:hypothetical protein